MGDVPCARGAHRDCSAQFVLLPGSNGAVLIKNSLQLVSNIGGIAMLNVTALHHVDQLPVFEQR